MHNRFMIALSVCLLPFCASAQTEDPRIAQKRSAIETEMKTRLEADRAFMATLEGKTPAEREAAVKARRDLRRQEALQRAEKSGTNVSEQTESPAVSQKRTEMENEMNARINADRAFMHTLEGKTPAEREAAVKARRDQRRQETQQRAGKVGTPVTGQNETPELMQKRTEMQNEMKARLDADRAFVKSLEGKTPAEREAAIKERKEQRRQIQK